MLLSDRDLKAALASGRMALTPYDEAMVQPSSIDVRLDRFFRVFANHRYTHIDPALEQDELTELVEVGDDESFLLHPGEFVLGSTLEVITLGDDLASRLEGKALALDTEVPTPWGWTTMEHLEVGDEVFDEQGRPTTVVATTDPMNDRPCYEVLLSDGTRFIADASHQWVTRTKADRSAGRSGSSRTTEQLAATLRAGREWNHHIAMAGPAQYAERDDLPIDPYVLGIQLAATLRNPQHWDAGDSAKSLQAYLTGSVEQRVALLRGLSRADSGRVTLSCCLELAAESVVELAASLGLRPVLRKQRAVVQGIELGPGYTVSFSWEAPRARAVVAVRKMPSVPVRCIQVAAPSGMFLVGRTYVPTHNSSLGRLGLLTHSTAGFIDPGFSGHVTLELSNVANLPIKLYPGMKIGQICVLPLSSASEHPYGSAVYGSRYQGQRGPTPSRSHLRFTRTPTD
jgi:deoxycytidine triphosphate deaminase